MRKKNPNIEIIVEKSPPNMVRIEKLSSLFKSYSILAYNRNPYANCASMLYRHFDADNIDDKARKIALTSLANKWIIRSSIIKDLIQKQNVPFLTYEDFSSSPEKIIHKIPLPKNITENLDPYATIKVKDYPPQTISNHNTRQIAKLKSHEIAFLSKIFSKHKELLLTFGYTLL